MARAGTRLAATDSIDNQWLEDVPEYAQIRDGSVNTILRGRVFLLVKGEHTQMEAH